jgi:hypothetical protein
VNRFFHILALPLDGTTHLLLLVACLLIIFGVSPAQCSGQSVEDRLLNTRVDLHLQNGTLLEALSKLASKRLVPIGFEPSLTYKAEYHLNIDLENVTLNEVLDRIIQDEPSYRWGIRDGVINFTPACDIDPVVEKLLGLAIRSFDPSKGLSKFEIRDAIVALPEVVAFLKTNGLTASHYGFWYYPSADPTPEVDLSLSNTDLRAVLNRVIRESDHKMWTVSRSGANRGSLDLGF